MKAKIVYLLLLTISSMFISCGSNENEPALEEDLNLNKIYGTINGKDTVMDIKQIYITNFSKFLSYNLPNQQLSVISEVPTNGGYQFDFYATDTTEIKINKKHFIVNPYQARSLGICTAYIHRYSSSGGYPAVLSANTLDENYYCLITKLENNIIQGDIKYVVNDIVFIGKFYSDKLEYKNSSN